MSASDFSGLPFTMRVFELAKGWRLEIDAGQDRAAEIVADDLGVALAMIMEFVKAMCVPVPLPADLLERLYRQASAPDGPPDAGGLADG